MRVVATPLRTSPASLLQIPPSPRTCRIPLLASSKGRKSFHGTTSKRPNTTTILTARSTTGHTLTAVSSPKEIPSTSEDVVRAFYDGVNRRDLSSVAPLFAEDCVYEDLVFPAPFVGREAILEFFEKFMESISSDCKFCIDDISDGDSAAVGVTWHLEWQGKAFPFSRGCSFYKLNLKDGKKQIVYGRDCVEPAIKPGESTLVIIQGLTWILQRFPQIVKLMK